MQDVLPVIPYSTQVLNPDEPGYPRGLLNCQTQLTVHARGNPALLERHLIGLFCSIRCPGGAILRAFDWIKTLPPAGVAVVSGFHSPIEQECLSLLLRRGIAVVICPAREITHYRYPESWEPALASGQLLMLSPFATDKRATAVLAEKRSAFVAALSDALVVIHGPEGSRTRAAVEQAANKPVTELC